jgi:hypothetical protein
LSENGTGGGERPDDKRAVFQNGFFGGEETHQQRLEFPSHFREGLGGFTGGGIRVFHDRQPHAKCL